VSKKKADKDAELTAAVKELEPIMDRLTESKDARVRGLGALVAAGCAGALAGERAIYVMNVMVQPIMTRLEEGLRRMEKKVFKPEKRKGK
jgi:hypothetical protein